MYNSFKLNPRGSGSSTSSIAQGRDQKRSKVSLACNACRKNKTKCDGKAPCSQCVSISEVCVHDGVDGRRASTHKRNLADAQLERDQLLTLFEHLRNSDSENASLLYARIRQGELVEDLLKQTAESEVARASTNPSIEKAVVTMLSGTQIGFEGGVEYIAPNTSNDMWDVTWPIVTNPRERLSWTRVSISEALVDHLLEIYFCWLHHHIPLFSKFYFLQALESGDPRYCSDVLVNAMLSASCFYCQPAGPPGPAPREIDFRNLSSEFMSETETLLLKESDKGECSMTSVQALVILAFSYVQLDENTKTKMWNCLGRASVMMQTLNLDNHLGDELARRTDAASITFWGLLIADRLSTHICGRRGHVRTPGRPRRPIHVQTSPDDTWVAINPVPFITRRNELFVEVASAQHDLFNIIDEIQSFSYLFRAPLKVVEINSMYRKLHDWKILLPVEMHRLENAAPNLFHLMAMYHAILLRLFRPLAQTMNRTFAIDPHMACREAASAIIELETAYASNFGAYFSNIYHLHHIFAAACTYLGDLSDNNSLALFMKCLDLMQRLEVRFKGPVQRALHCVFHFLHRWKQLTPKVWAVAKDVAMVSKPNGSLIQILENYKPLDADAMNLTEDDNTLIYEETRVALETGDFDFLFSDWLRADIIGRGLLREMEMGADLDPVDSQ